MTYEKLQVLKRHGSFLARWGSVITIAWGAASLIISHVDRLVTVIHDLDVRITQVEQYRDNHESVSHERINRIDRIEDRLDRFEQTRGIGWAEFDSRLHALEQRAGK